MFYIFLISTSSFRFSCIYSPAPKSQWHGVVCDDDDFVFLDDDGNTVINKRTEKGIWHNLYQFPLLETATALDDEAILSLIKEQNFIANEIDTIDLYNTESSIHKLSHQHLTIKFWKVTVKGKINGGIDCKSAAEFPFPIVIFNFISKYWF